MIETRADAVVSGVPTKETGDNEIFQKLTILFGAGTALSGILGILGLYFGISFFSSYKTIAFSSAIVWICFGSILLIHAVRPLKGMARNCVAIIIAVIAIIAAIEFSLSILGKHYIFEGYFIVLGNTLTGYPTTPISPISVGLILPAAIGLYILLFIRDDSGRIDLCQDCIGTIGLLVSLVSFTFLLSYLYGAPFLYNTSILPMAFMSALGGLFFSFGLIVSVGPDAFPLKYILGSSLAARLLRTFLPLTLAIILVESILDVIMKSFNVFNNALELAIILVLFSVITIYVVTKAAQGLGGTMEAEERERKRAEKALEQANKKLNLLTSITRHDINNQLFTIKAFLELLKEDLGDAASAAESIKKIEQSANAIEHQIRFTVDYEEMGVKAPAWQNVEAIIRAATRELPMRGIQVSVDRPDLEVNADPLFRKVFYNLIDNALRYGGTGMSEIRVSSQQGPAGSLVIIIEDNGVGIAAEDKAHIFSRGFGKNTGLGLFLSAEILSITDITIKETGEAGKGARFEISVPNRDYRYKEPHSSAG